MDYLLEAKVAATVAEEINGATTNAKARALLPEHLRNNPVLYPSDEVLARGEWFRPLPGQVQQLRDRYWTEVKSA